MSSLWQYTFEATKFFQSGIYTVYQGWVLLQQISSEGTLHILDILKADPEDPWVSPGIADLQLLL